MPHSITDDAMSSPGAIKDEPMEDLAIPAEVAAANGESNGSGDASEPHAVKSEVKLDELFADIDSDIDALDSPGADQPASSGSPAAGPGSPM